MRSHGSQVASQQDFVNCHLNDAVFKMKSLRGHPVCRNLEVAEATNGLPSGSPHPAAAGRERRQLADSSR